MITEKELNEMFVLKAKAEERAREVALIYFGVIGYQVEFEWREVNTVIFTGQVHVKYAHEKYIKHQSINFPTKYLFMADEEIVAAVVAGKEEQRKRRKGRRKL